jgi:catechol-2,3-dioxygenase
MKISQLELQAKDLSAQRRFYGDVLHLPTVETHGTVSVQVGRSRIVFKEPQNGAPRAYHFAFNIPEKRFEEAKAWISERVPLLKSSTGEDSFNFANWNAHACYFLDPAGNIVEFIARHVLTDDSDLPFGERSILCVSEIGIATGDVKATVQSLQAHGLPVYDGEGSDTFTAVGDEHGLFIVIKRGRTWFPDSGTPADFLPLRAVVSLDSGATAILSDLGFGNWNFGFI